MIWTMRRCRVAVASAIVRVPLVYPVLRRKSRLWSARSWVPWMADSASKCPGRDVSLPCLRSSASRNLRLFSSLAEGVDSVGSIPASVNDSRHERVDTADFSGRKVPNGRITNVVPVVVGQCTEQAGKKLVTGGNFPSRSEAFYCWPGMRRHSRHAHEPSRTSARSCSLTSRTSHGCAT